MKNSDHTIGCTHFGRCSGCVYDACSIPPAIFERAHAFFLEHCHIDLRLKAGPVRYWRTKAKLAVRHNENNPREPLIGLFETHSHHVLPISHCQVHHPRINEAVSRFLKAFRETSLTAYHEASHRGDLRYLQFQVERGTNKVQLSVVLNRRSDNIEDWKRFCSELFSAEEGFWHSIWLNCNDKKSNTIFGREWLKVVGQDVIWEQICGKQFPFGPEHFSQANLPMYERLIEDIAQILPKDLKIADLYAGTGIIGTCLVEQSRHVSCIEIQPQAEPYFQMAKKACTDREQQKLSYLVAPAEKSLKLLEGLDACIVDPPRKGLGAACIDELLSTSSLQYVFYVSCDWNGFERDCRHILKAHPQWKIAHAISYLFFPGTNQIETLTLFSRHEL